MDEGDTGYTAGVFIGPFTSPEKRFLAVPIATPSPLRRSPRHSSPLLVPQVNDNSAPMEVDEGPSRSRSATPDNDGWQDEPSSVLASRVARAHDNPSPPPQEADSRPPTPQNQDPIPFPLAIHNPATVAAPASPFPPILDVPTANLISFDSSLTEVLPTPQPSLSNAPSIDELLGAWSPSGQQQRTTESSTPETEELQIVADSLIPPSDSDADSGAPVTPLRRSTRPRRSTPHAHLVPLPLSDDESTPTKTSPRTRRKGKEKDVENAALANAMLPEDDLPKRNKTPKKPSTVFGHRQLGSLSPGSANVLSQLSGPTPFAEPDETQRPFSFSVFAAESTPQPSSPMRASPPRNSRPNSPLRLQFQTQSTENVLQSPARRIPVEEAVASGQISPQRGAQLLSGVTNVGSSSKVPVFHIPPQDSPPRRIQLIPPTPSQGKWQGMRFGSPTRSKSPERAPSVEARPPWNGSTSGAPRGASTSRTNSSPTKDKLPFPIRSTVSESSSNANSGPSTEPPPTTIKIPRSTLKQPTSRIPRIGQKPYARPNINVSAATKLGPEQATSKVGKVIRVVNTTSSQSAEAGPSNLKRKRPPSPQNKTRPTTSRQIPPQNVVPNAQAASASTSIPSPVKRVPVTKPRVVELHRPVGIEAQSKAESSSDGLIKPATPTLKFQAVDLHASSIASSCRDNSPELVTELTPQLSREIPQLVHNISIPEVAIPPPPSPSPSPTPPIDIPPPEETLRRTTRVRRSLFPTTDPPQPVPTRRKAAPIFPSLLSGPFAGMSAVALKTLTSSNTTKNQRYLAAKLETQVIKKDGDRPESPGMKVKTVAQREADERNAKREQRAARRAGQGDDMTGSDDKMDVDSDLDSSPLRHQRGPGDEEDYETPRPTGKRLWSGGSSEDEVMEEKKKRVKWDRGLSTSVFLDELEPQPRKRPKEEVTLKGCLAPTAKVPNRGIHLLLCLTSSQALRLDSMGNHPKAESPLQELVEENIVIKKFVYDNDEPEPPPVVPVKTRSKSKKKS
ncbi:C3H1-type domain-containing protein [Mycena indigotica]|uniref:C3H1-type domain-containing protein n=1 Tax=Mycena indigotica TaxID=2126181 RepID=A0A8H6S8N3_9AGAR|nr:C3H1-type domain-containing protein [Mycena indigotica]KAF7294951.1 C3H1-type domain-containing protein [Mycena indigotica]